VVDPSLIWMIHTGCIALQGFLLPVSTRMHHSLGNIVYEAGLNTDLDSGACQTQPIVEYQSDWFYSYEANVLTELVLLNRAPLLVGGPDTAMSALLNGDADAVYMYAGIVEDRQVRVTSLVEREILICEYLSKLTECYVSRLHHSISTAAPIRAIHRVCSLERGRP